MPNPFYLQPGRFAGRRLPRPFGRYLPPTGKLPHVVDVYRQEDNRQDAGDRVPIDLAERTPLAINVPCWVQPMSPEEQLESMRLNLVLTHTIMFFQDPGIANSDMLLFQRRRILVVQGINNVLEVDHVWVATAREVS